MAMTPVNVTLYAGHATPANPVLRALPAVALVPVPVYLYAGHATPANVILRDPTDAPEVGGDIMCTGTAAILFTLSGTKVLEIPNTAAAAVAFAASVGTTVLEWPRTPSASLLFSATASAVGEIPTVGALSVLFTGAGTATVISPDTAPQILLPGRQVSRGAVPRLRIMRPPRR